MANEMLDRHQVLLHLFSDILGLPAEDAEQEACAVEHAIAGQTLERVTEFVSRHAPGCRVAVKRPRGAGERGRRHAPTPKPRSCGATAARCPSTRNASSRVLQESKSRDAEYVRKVIAKSLELKGLDEEEVAALVQVSDSDLLGELFAAARKVKEQIYGSRRGDVRSALHLQPVRQRMPLLRLPGAQQGDQAPRPHPGRDPRRGRSC